jgi:hypothetical protein
MFVGIMEQGVASLSTLVVSVVTARSATAEEFGAIANLMAVHFLWLGVVRSFTTTPALLFGSADGVSGGAGEDALAASSAMALLALPVFAFVGALSGDLRLGVVVGLASVALCAWDANRYRHIAALRPVLPLVAGAALLVVVSTGCMLLSIAQAATPMTTTLVWLASIVIVLGFFSTQSTFQSPFTKARALWQRNRGVGVGLSVEALLAAGASQFVVFAMSMLASLQWSAGFRAVSTIALGPLSTLLMGVTPQLQLFVRGLVQSDISPRRYRMNLVLVTGGLGVLGLVYGLALRIVPEALMEDLSGDSWTLGKHMLASTVLLTVAAAAATVILGDARYRWGAQRAVAMRAGATLAGLGTFGVVTLVHGGDPRLGLALYGAILALLPLATVLRARGKPVVLAMGRRDVET